MRPVCHEVERNNQSVPIPLPNAPVKYISHFTTLPFKFPKISSFFTNSLSSSQEVKSLVIAWRWFVSRESRPWLLRAKSSGCLIGPQKKSAGKWHTSSGFAVFQVWAVTDSHRCPRWFFFLSSHWSLRRQGTWKVLDDYCPHILPKHAF